MEYTQKQEQINLDQTWEIFCHRHPQTHKPHKMLLELFNKLVFGQNKLTDMIFVKTFTLVDFDPVIFYPYVRNLPES